MIFLMSDMHDFNVSGARDLTRILRTSDLVPTSLIVLGASRQGDPKECERILGGIKALQEAFSLEPHQIMLLPGPQEKDRGSRFNTHLHKPIMGIDYQPDCLRILPIATGHNLFALDTCRTKVGVPESQLIQAYQTVKAQTHAHLGMVFYHPLQNWTELPLGALQELPLTFCLHGMVDAYGTFGNIRSYGTTAQVAKIIHPQTRFVTTLAFSCERWFLSSAIAGK